MRFLCGFIKQGATRALKCFNVVGLVALSYKLNKRIRLDFDFGSYRIILDVIILKEILIKFDIVKSVAKTIR